MQKIAQKRSIINKYIKDMTDISGIAAEKFFNPEFKRVMESLRAKDDTIRSIVAGEAIGDGDPGADPIALKSLIKTITSNLNRREYMSAIADLGRFHKKVFDIVQEINNLNLDVDAVHHDFLFKELGDEQKQYLQDLKTRFAASQALLIKEASIMDFFYNIGTKRGRALAAWEKRYPKQVGKLKKDTNNLLKKSESFLFSILSALKEMDYARSTRNVDSYVKSADKIVKHYVSYDKLFKDFYVSNVKGFLEKVELVSPTAKAPEAKEMGQQELPIEEKVPDTINDRVPPTVDDISLQTYQDKPVSYFNETEATTNENPVRSTLPSVPDLTETLPIESAPDTTPSPTPSMSEDESKRDQFAKEMKFRVAHNRFLSSLESLSQEDPIIIASFIAKYAKSIKNSDPGISSKLLKLAKHIRG